MAGIGTSTGASPAPRTRTRSRTPARTVVQDGITLPPSALPSPRVAEAPYEQHALTPDGRPATTIPGTESLRPAATAAPVSIDAANTGPLEIGMPAGDIAGPIAEPKRGMFDRLNDWRKSDEGRGALIRSAGATLQGGLGAGITAAAGWVDQRNERAEQKRRYGIDTALRERGVVVQEEGGDTQRMSVEGSLANEAARLGISVAELEERRRSNMATEGIQRDNIRSDNWRHVTPSGNAVVGETGANFRHITPSGNTVAGEEGANYRHTTPSGNAVLGASTSLATAGIGSRANQPTETTVVTTPAQEAVNGWFSDTPATPETKVTTVRPLDAAPPAVVTPGQGAETPTAESIALLRSNPGLVAQFERRFGPGTAAQYLGGR